MPRKKAMGGPVITTGGMKQKSNFAGGKSMKKGSAGSSWDAPAKRPAPKQNYNKRTTPAVPRAPKDGSKGVQPFTSPSSKRGPRGT